MKVYKALSLLSINNDFYQWKMPEKLNQSLCLVSGMLLVPLQFCLLKTFRDALYGSELICFGEAQVKYESNCSIELVFVVFFLFFVFFPCLCLPAMFGLALFGASLGLVF